MDSVFLNLTNFFETDLENYNIKIDLNFTNIISLYISKMSTQEHKIIKSVFSDKSDKRKSNSFVQIYDIENGTFVIKIYNYV